MMSMNDSAAAEPKQVGRPNVIVLFIDDMGYGDPGVYGNPIMKTPRIDQLAAEGVRLMQFYTKSPICSPSRVAVMTGQSPQRFAFYGHQDTRARNDDRGMANWLDPNATTLPRLLQEAGYATAHFGKWHMGGGRDIGDAPLPTEYGFDESLVSFEGLGDRLLLKGEGLSEWSEKLGRGNIRWVDKSDVTGLLVDRSLDFIRQHRDEPFYLHLWPGDVHDPFKPSEAALAKVKHLSDDPEWQKFYAVLAEMDAQIGRLVDGIDEMGLGDDTLILLTSDNGPTAWPHYYESGKGEGAAPGYTGGFRGRKWSLYEGGIRMPFIARWTGHTVPGTVNETTISTTADLLPSICAIAGVELPDGYEPDGINLGDTYLGKARPVREQPVFFEYNSLGGNLAPFLEKDRSPTLAVRAGDWKLLMNPGGEDVELYNLADDPAEQHNVTDANPEIVEGLKQALGAWYVEVKADGEATRERLGQ